MAQAIAALEAKINHPEKSERLAALRALTELEKRGALPAPQAGGYVNNHIHTTYSFSPYSPCAAAYTARKAGLTTAGIMDHDSVGGCPEFIEAGRILCMPVTCGFELRVNMRGTPFDGKTLNNPDQASVAYVAAHGIPHQKLGECEAFLAPCRQQRNLRNRRMTENLNAILKDSRLALDFERDILPLSQFQDGGSVTERHILCGLSRKIIDAYGRGAGTLAFLQEELALPVPEKVLGYLMDAENPHYLYDVLGVLKSALVSRFYVDATDECPDVNAFLEFTQSIGAISAYAYLGDVTDSVTGDKKAQKFEDDYLDELFAWLKQCGFRAVTYMPSRNTMAQLERVMALCARHELFQISGEDINTSRQSFICPALAKPAFRHLNTATWVLIGHELAASRRVEDGMFSAETARAYSALGSRIPVFEAIGKTSALVVGCTAPELDA